MAEKYLAAALTVALALCVGTLLERVAASADFNWNPIRLAPAFAIRHGQTVYPGVNDGPVSGHIYGPIAALVYLPAVFCESPVTAVRVASVIASAVFFLPVLMLFFVTAGSTRRAWLWAMWGWLFFFLLVLRSDALSYNAFNIHAEAPALGLAAAACVLLAKTTERIKWHLPAAAFLAVLALESKQTLLPVLVALPLYLWFSRGFPTALRFSGWLAVSLLVTGGVFACWFGAQELWYNQIVIPSKHPWLRSIKDTSLPWIYERDNGARLTVLLEAGQGLLRRGAKALLVLGGLFLWQTFFNGSVSKPTDNPGISRLASWIRQPWGLCCWLALWLAPTSLLGRVKAGGDNNAYGPAIFFLCLGAALWLIHLLHERNSEKPFPAAHAGWLLWPVMACASVAAAWLLLITTKNLKRTENHPMNLAVSYARQHPGQVYFPWNPLLTLMSEQRAYHFAYGVYDRALAGRPVTPEHFRTGLPADIQEVLCARNEDRSLLAVHLTNYTREVRLPELPGWVILRRDDAEPITSSPVAGER